MKERFAGSDYRFIVICLALLAGAVWFTAGNFYRAFPEASIDFRVSRSEAAMPAPQFLEGQGYRLSGYRDASSFSYDDDAKTFLEREAGLERANQLMGTRVHLWRWAFRWFRPQQKEEFRADVTPAGDSRAFDHELRKTPRVPTSPPTRRARWRRSSCARARIATRRSLDFVESSSVARPHRVGPHLHLEGARFRRPRRHQPRGRHRPRQRSRRLRRVSEDSRAMDPRL